METLVKVAACAVTVAILGTAVKTRSAELALALALGACAVLAAASLPLVRQAFSYLDELRETAALAPSLVSPVIKVCAVSMLTQFACAFCREAGQASAAKIVELCGGAAALCAMLPLMDAVLNMVREMLW
ncbi:MAG: stage III sporulation AC/AD family protein [Oscillospiraceae bacterium]|nr:stage III sporulation AC/AD family protein [Oscillospiraceae bacterium]